MGRNQDADAVERKLYPIYDALDSRNPKVMARLISALAAPRSKLGRVGLHILCGLRASKLWSCPQPCSAQCCFLRKS